MNKYVYPAIFTPESTGWSIHFPDLEGCYTCGDDLKDGIEMAQDALALVLYEYEANNRIIPPPGNLEDIILKEGQFVNYILCDTMVYRKKYRNKAIKKTLTIPEWLNEAASNAGLNFSQILQEALSKRLQAK